VNSIHLTDRPPFPRSTPVLAGFLFGMAPRDPAVFIGVPIVLGRVAFEAVWLPARRASRLEPMVALRHD
jgi:putative ABC transport system permease protein